MSPHNGSEEETGAGRVIVSVDAMGGDRGPAAVIAGIARAMGKLPDLHVVLHGRAEELERLLARRRGLSGRIDLRHCEDVVSMDEKPSHAMRHGQGSSMWSALEAVRSGEAEVCVSCGNTGALMALAMLRLRKAPGVNRPAIATLWPSRNPGGRNVMLDVGADIRADPSDLLQYAQMGASYARNGLDIPVPRVGLLNVGTEETKGRAELKAAHDLLAEHAERGGFTFLGYVEGGDITSAEVDVIVTDGFTGNVALKTAEGVAALIREFLGDAFRHSIWSRLGALFALTSLKRLQKRIDPRRLNGGVFLGLNGTVVKSHGSADAIGVASAIMLAHRLARSRFTARVAARVASGGPALHDGVTLDLDDGTSP